MKAGGNKKIVALPACLVWLGIITIIALPQMQSIPNHLGVCPLLS